MSNDELIQAIKTNDLDQVKTLVEQGANIHADNDFAVRRFQFRQCDECPITHETFTDEMKKLVCSKCKNVFSKEVLEDWFVVQGKKCPLRCKGAEFYEINSP